MTRTLLCRLSVTVFIIVLLAALAPAANAQGPTPSGTYALTFYNFISDEGGAACPSGAVVSTTDSALGTFRFWPENTSPIAGVNINQYTACWDGWITFPSQSNWFVQTINDDGMDVWVDGNITMRAWYDQGPTLHNGTFSIDPNVAHRVIIKYYNRTLGATACVGWGAQGGGPAYWNCPTAQTVAQAPVYTPPVYTPPTTPPFYGNVPCATNIGGQIYYPPAQPNAPLCTQVPGQLYAPPQQYFPYPYGSGYNKPGLPAGFCVYVIRRGDTLSRIAWRYGTNYWTLANMNGIANPSRIYAGMPIVVPNCR